MNGADCQPRGDLPGDYQRPAGGARPVVESVAEVAPRVVQFSVPLAAIRRGYNAIELTLEEGPEQRLVWLEVAVSP